MRKHIKTPNTLIEDLTMHHSSKRVAVAMLFYARRNGEFRETCESLAKKTGRRRDKDGTEKNGCSPATVQQAVAELEAGGYLRKNRNYRYSKGLCRPVYAANSYEFTPDWSRGYTLIPASILKLPLTSAEFCVLLYLYRCAGRDGRAFPSLRHIMGVLKNQMIRGLGMAKSTVIRALKRLEELRVFIKTSCVTRAGDHSMNTYLLTGMVPKRRHAASAPEQGHDTTAGMGLSIPEGWYYFWQASPNNKITLGFIRREREKGVRQFVNLNSFLEDLTEEPNRCPPPKDTAQAETQGSSLPVFREIGQAAVSIRRTIRDAASCILPKIKQNLSKIRGKGGGRGQTV